jgi:hypothetical protein
MNVLSRSLISLGLLVGCAGARDTPPTSVAIAPASTVVAPPVEPAPPPVPPPPEVRVAAPGCGYGGSAPGAALFVDIDSDLALHHVAVSFALTTLDDTPIALSRPPARDYGQLYVSPVERGVTDYGTEGLARFDGTVTPHAPIRVELFTGLRNDPAAASPAPRLGGSMRLHVTVSADEGTYTTTCDTEPMWASS